MSKQRSLNDILLPEDDILTSDDDTLKDRISKLSKILEEGDLPVDDVVKIKYYQKLYSKFTKENEHYFQLENILASINDDLVPSESRDLAAKSQEDDQRNDVRDLASQTELEPYMLSWSVMKSLSRQVYEELMERFGNPVVVKVATQFITIGTKSSKILIFDLKQRLIGILDPPLQFAVTSLGISYSEKLVVSGHESGHIFIWDRLQRTVIKALIPIPSNIFQENLDGHLASSSIIHITFVGQKDRFISADDTGTAFYHELNQVILMYSINSLRIHNHPREHIRPTTIYNIKALPSRYVNSDSMRMVAITTPYKLIIMNMKPTPWIVFRFFWASDGQNETNTVSSSCLSWLPISETKSPKLAVSFGSKIILLNLYYAQDTLLLSEMSITIHKEWKMSEIVVFMEWITESLLLCLTNRSNAVFIDTVQGKYLEQTSIQSLKLLSTSCFSSKLLTATVPPREKSYHQTIVLLKKRLFCLGTNQMVIASPVGWKDRINYLMDHNEYFRAFEMAETFYEGKILYAVIDISDDQEKRRETIGDFMGAMIIKYLDYLSNTVAQKQQSEVERISNMLFSVAIKIRKIDLIFSNIHDFFDKSKLLRQFNESLEARILNGDISSILLPSIMRDLLDYFISQGLYNRLENILVKLDLKVLDIDSTLLLCSDHFLLRAMIRIYNLCLKEYIAPLYEIIKLLQRSRIISDSPRVAEIEILFDYLDSCLVQSVSGVPSACIKFLFSTNHVPDSLSVSILQTLADFNLKKLFLVCERSLNLPLSSLNISTPSNAIIDKSFIIQSLLNLSTKMQKSSGSEIDLFVSKMLIKHALTFAPDAVKSLILRLAHSQLSTEDLQDSIISLMNFYSDIDVNDEEFRNSNFWKVVEFLGRRNHKYDLVMEGLIRNPFKRLSLLEDLDLLYSSVTPSDFESLKNLFYRELESLVSLKIGISSLVSTFHFDHNYCISLLSPSSQLLYLNELFSDSSFSNVELYDKYLFLLCQYDPHRLKSQLLQASHSFTTQTLVDHCKSYKILDAYIYLEQDPVKCLEFLQASVPSCLEYMVPVLEFCKCHPNLNLEHFYSSLFQESSKSVSIEPHLDLLLSSLPLKTCISLIKLNSSNLHLIQNHLSSESVLHESLIRIIRQESLFELEKLVKLKRKAIRSRHI